MDPRSNESCAVAQFLDMQCTLTLEARLGYAWMIMYHDPNSFFTIQLFKSNYFLDQECIGLWSDFYRTQCLNLVELVRASLRDYAKLIN
jgi:hypothetical protein